MDPLSRSDEDSMVELGVCFHYVQLSALLRHKDDWIRV